MHFHILMVKVGTIKYYEVQCRMKYKVLLQGIFVSTALEAALSGFVEIVAQQLH